jgi:hypothetical protein
MNAILLGSTLLAVAWLAIWSVKDHTRPSKTWWPFAMREATKPKPKGRWGPYRPADGSEGNRTPEQRPWRRSGF